jgi:hypothetical protein
MLSLGCVAATCFMTNCGCLKPWRLTEISAEHGLSFAGVWCFGHAAWEGGSMHICAQRGEQGRPLFVLDVGNGTSNGSQIRRSGNGNRTSSEGSKRQGELELFICGLWFCPSPSKGQSLE